MKLAFNVSSQNGRNFVVEKNNNFVKPKRQFLCFVLNNTVRRFSSGLCVSMGNVTEINNSSKEK